MFHETDSLNEVFKLTGPQTQALVSGEAILSIQLILKSDNKRVKTRPRHSNKFST